jgi:hypothetical protein
MDAMRARDLWIGSVADAWTRRTIARRGNSHKIVRDLMARWAGRRGFIGWKRAGMMRAAAAKKGEMAYDYARHGRIRPNTRGDSRTHRRDPELPPALTGLG